MPKKYTEKERITKFWQRVKIKSLFDCWEWTGYQNTLGYGRMGDGSGHLILTHRISWILTFGDIPKKMCVLHKCDNPSCCNPNHLYLGTRLDNSNDMIARNRQRHQEGSLNGNSKLKGDDIREIRLLLKQGLTQEFIANKYGVQHTCVSKIKHRVTWNHID